jgi:hypothetical protein
MESLFHFKLHIGMTETSAANFQTQANDERSKKTVQCKEKKVGMGSIPGDGTR